MNRKTLMMLSLMLVANMVSYAAPVGRTVARAVAETFMQAAGMPKPSSLNDITAQVGLDMMYVFTAADGGFVVVSADDAAQPVLAYSLTSPFATSASAMPAHVRSWFSTYEAAIRHLQQIKATAPDDVAAQWAALSNGTVPPPLLTTPVAPLLTTTWDQYPYYNDQCPYDSDAGEHAVAGCVATATAQVMKYWNHPTTGYGSHSYTDSEFGSQSADFGNTTYDWANMPSILTGTSSATQVNAVAQLIYHIGVAVEMSYGVDGSGASIPTSELVDYFKYSPTLYRASKGNYMVDEWHQLIRTELDSLRPVIYRGDGGDGNSGHAFVCDGYDANDLFHINWGWSGSCDGYYQLEILTPGSSGVGGNASDNYSYDCAAIVGIKPVSSGFGTPTTVMATATGGAGCSVAGSASYPFQSTVNLTATAAEGYRFVQWSDGCRNNPRSFTSTGGSIGLTARFEPLQGDLVGYCSPTSVVRRWNSSSVWGIRLPASSLQAGHDLRAVRMFVDESDTYTVSIHIGSATAIAAATVSLTLSSVPYEGQWATFVLPTPVPIDATQPIWIRVEANSANWPATLTTYSGNADGYLTGNTLAPTNSTNGSFMIMGVFSATATVSVGGTVDNAGTGTVSGTGSYAVGSQVVLTAEPAEGYYFVAWNDGSTENPRTVVALTDTVYTAIMAVDPCIVSDLPWVEDFDGETAACWQLVEGNGYGGYHIYSSSTPHSGSYVLWGSYDDYGDVDAWALSPAIVVPLNAVGVSLEWWVRGSIYAGLPTSYQVLLAPGGSSLPEAFTVQLYAETTTSADAHQWRQRSVDLSAYAGQTIRLAFRNVSVQGGNILLFDDVSLTATDYTPMPQYTVTVLSAADTMGTVSGGGTFDYGTSITIAATPAEGYRFVQWDDGPTENPRTIVVVADTTYTARFEAVEVQGIATVDADVVRTRVQGHSIVVESPAGCEVSLFDMSGRQLAATRSAGTTLRLQVPAAGVYMVRTSATTTHKVVVVDR